MNGELLALDPDGTTRWVLATAEGVADGMHGALLDVAYHGLVAAFVEDEGLLNGALLNVVASIMLERPIYGTVVLIHPDPTPTGESRPPDKRVTNAAERMAQAWWNVWFEASRIGQPLVAAADPDNIPPFVILDWPES